MRTHRFMLFTIKRSRLRWECCEAAKGEAHYRQQLGSRIKRNWFNNRWSTSLTVYQILKDNETKRSSKHASGILSYSGGTIQIKRGGNRRARRKS